MCGLGGGFPDPAGGGRGGRQALPGLPGLGGLGIPLFRGTGGGELEVESEAELGSVAQLEPSPEDEVDVAGSVVARRPRARPSATGPARKSARLHGPEAALPTVEKAQRRAAARNLETGNPSSSFAILQDLPDSHLAAVVHDVGLAFAIEKGTDSEILSLVRAKEAAQAAIAEATFRRDLAAAAQATAGSSSEPDRVEGSTLSETPGAAGPSAAPSAPPDQGCDWH